MDRQISINRSTFVHEHHASSACQLCGQSDHVARNCPQFLIQPNCPMANFLATLCDSTNNWLIDLGANSHVTTELANLVLHSKYTDLDKLLIGDGLGLKITHVGQTTISTQNISLPLNNVLCVSSASRNLISVSQLCKSANVIVEFHVTHVFVKDRRTGVILLCGQNKNGVYEFPFVNHS
ncbi:hypothetical protein SLA2020_321910 [Shorea laevis]